MLARFKTRHLQLYDFQKDLLHRILDAWEAGLWSVICQLSTGAGKTEIAAHIIADILDVDPNASVVFLTPSEPLVGQTLERLWQYGIKCVNGSRMGKVRGAWAKGKPLPSGVVVVCADTYLRRVNEAVRDGTSLPHPRLIVCDEAHRYGMNSSWTRILADVDSKGNVVRRAERVLGLSATPWRLNNTDSFIPVWEGMVYGPTTRHLIDAGYLSGFDVLDLDRIRGVRKARVGKDDEDSYDNHALWAQADEKQKGTLTKDAVKLWTVYANRRRTIVFALTVEHAKLVKDAFRKAGYRAELILGETPGPERVEIMGRFRSGVTQIIIAVDVIREGVDVPDADCVLVLRPTESLALWLQMCGRVLRPKPHKALIFDLTDNSKRLGWPDGHFLWQLSPRVLPGGNEPPMRTCSCGVELHPSLRQCWNCNVMMGKWCPDINTIGVDITEGCQSFRYWNDWDVDTLLNKKYPGLCTPCAKLRHEAQLAIEADARRAKMAALRESSRHEAAERRDRNAASVITLQWSPSQNGNGYTARGAMVRFIVVPSKYGGGWRWSCQPRNDDGRPIHTVKKGWHSAPSERMAKANAEQAITKVFRGSIGDERAMRLFAAEIGKRCDCGMLIANVKYDQCWNCANGPAIPASEMQVAVSSR